VNDTPGIIPDVIGMGANDAVYLLEKSGLKAEMSGFGRVFRQSPISGTPSVKGDIVSLELGFDDLQIVKRDSLNKNDSIQAAAFNPVPVQKPVQPEMAPEVVSPKVNKNAVDKSKVIKNQATKPKASPEAIAKWKAKVAAQKALEAKGGNKKTTVKPKASPEAIAKWKAKVAAQKAAEKKKNATKKNTAQPKK
jgi:hypothetical protein